MSDVRVDPVGPFSLAASARFIAGWPPATATGRAAEGAAGAVVRLGFLVDDWTGHAGVVLRQEAPDEAVQVTPVGGTARDARRAIDQALRVVSLDHDGRGYAEVGRRDAVVGSLQEASGWLRPVLFHSPYEAACWAVISARTSHAQAVTVRARLARDHGATVEVDGDALLGFPTPERLARVADVAGLPEEKLRRLRGVADAALDGRLDRERLLALPAQEATRELLGLRGVGPFAASLILLRAVGPTDVLTHAEPRLRAAAAAAYAAPEVTADDDAFAALAERWRPFRTWVSVLLRAAGTPSVARA